MAYRRIVEVEIAASGAGHFSYQIRHLTLSFSALRSSLIYTYLEPYNGILFLEIRAMNHLRQLEQL